jgi:hypothetical protein
MRKTSVARIERFAWGGWAEAYRLSNGDAALVVVPAVSRILHYGFAGGENLLWQNASVAGRPPDAEQWTNYGGSKTWIWPDHEWPTRTGSAWPPPTDLPSTIGSTAEVRGEGVLRLTSSPIPGFGLTLVRDVRLADSGTRVEIRSEIRKDGGVEFAIAAWTVTQMPADGALFARLMKGSRLADGYKSYFGSFAAVTHEGPEVLVIERRSAEYAKIGMDADLLAWQRGELLFVERPADRDTSLAAFALGDRAQIYSHLDADPNLPPGVSYVEMELTSPMSAPRLGESVTLETSWEILRLGPGETARAAVAAKLRAI